MYILCVSALLNQVIANNDFGFDRTLVLTVLATDNVHNGVKYFLKNHQLFHALHFMRFFYLFWKIQGLCVD